MKKKMIHAVRKVLKITAAGAVCFGCAYAGSAAADTSAGTASVSTSSTGNTITLTKYSSDSTDTALSGEEAASIISPSVVSITTEAVQQGQAWYGSYVTSGAGSGVILSSDGYILTCAHVVDDADTVTVTTSDGTEYDAEVVGSDTADDIAVLKIDATDLTAAVIGDSDAASVGETVYADGNPGGTLSGTITEGIVSALNREITVETDSGEAITLNVIQTSAAVSPGSSGGGLFNDQGELIGVVNAKSSDTSDEGLGFAIPINDAISIAKNIIENGAFSVSESTNNMSSDMTGGAAWNQTGMNGRMGA
ncbi:MAG: S1C family serine protease [Solobacterium sp.]|jgi:serine protease Do|nr:S1C family serine protease [Solobacterium sp.]MCH4048708.1 S1C family serine protease [Solobacterium sp.]MCH4074538.1 S1C family serine protease [Solobacterium sp.]MCI1459461.1 S1C family serine protease [Solobacterium sp.]